MADLFLGRPRSRRYPKFNIRRDIPALVAATRIGAKAIGVEDKLGTVEAGKWADLLILNADPLKDIRNIREIDLIIRDGQVHSRSDFAYRSGV